MNFSKVIRRHIHSAEFSLIVISHIVNSEIPKINDLKEIELIKEDLTEILLYISPTYPELEINTQQYKLYKNTQLKIKNLFDSFYKDFKPDIDLLNVVLYLIENRYSESKYSKTIILQSRWGFILDHFYSFYKQIDIDIKEYKLIRLGAEFGKKMEKII